MLSDPKKFLASLPDKPGVYQMCNSEHQVLYVGKAKSLKKRLRSYFAAVKDTKTTAFMAKVKDVEIIITNNENAALLLESNLIKTLKPRYNILFKDDKSFPYLILSHHKFPRITIYRGSLKKIKGKYFGPFPSSSAVNLTSDLLQKLFHLRVCKDSFLRNRTRPCMLYQIKLCEAPCTGCISKEDYAVRVKMVEQFLNNKSDSVIQELTRLMDNAATKLDYEQAASYRDQIAKVRKMQIQQSVIKDRGNCDVIALVVDDNAICIDVLFVRNGLLLGNKPYFPVTPKLNLSPDEILTTFLLQHYLQNENGAVIPDKILINIKISSRLKIAALLSEKSNHKLVLVYRSQGVKKHLIAMAEANALNAIKTRHTNSVNYIEKLQEFQKTFNLSTLPKRMECFDVSHMMGEAQIASCVVFDGNGPSKKDYRRFNVKSAKGTDDCYALYETLCRRYKEKKDLPDVIMVDGGKGQLNVAKRVLQELHLDDIFLIAVAKGSERKRGLEEIYTKDKKDPLVLSPQSPALHLIQQVRDEAHRFAISGHRKKLIKLRRQSVLDNISGVGKAKQIALLKYFGGLTELKSAGIEDLIKVKGISTNLAQRIYRHLHAE